jgi:hypothetical protein
LLPGGRSYVARQLDSFHQNFVLVPFIGNGCYTNVAHDQVIAPILAAVRTPASDATAHWTRVDRDYERIRIDMQTLFSDLAIEMPLAA